METPKQKRKQYFLIFEEAQTYFPEGCMRAKRFENTTMLMSEGRNYDVRFMCITQFSSLIAKSAMRYMKQGYFCFTDKYNDMEYLKSFLGDKAHELKTLDAEQFLYYHGGNIQKISIEPYTSATPKTQIVIPQSKLIPISEKPKTQTNNLDAVISLLSFGLWFVLLLVVLGQM